MDSISEAEVFAALPPPECRSFLTEYVHKYAIHCTDAHASYHVAAGLIALSQCCPIDYAFPFGVPMHSNVYGLCVGRSSDARKSASLSIVRDILDAALPGAVGEVPGSPEKLIDSLKANPRQAILYPEFGSFLSLAEKGYMNPLKTAFTEAWDGSPLGRSLVKKQDTAAKNPRLSMLAASTLEYLERHTELADWTGGFMARFITFYADRQRMLTVPPGDRLKRGEMISWLTQLASFSVFGVQRGECKGFSSDARAIWDSWYQSINKLGASEEIAGSIARSHSHALRIALLLAWDYGNARSGYDWYITPRELLPALALTNLHLRSVKRIGANLSGSRDMRDRRSVLNAISFNEPTPLGQIIANSRLLLRRVREIIETLAEEGLITSSNVPNQVGQCFVRAPTKNTLTAVTAAADALQSPAVADGSNVVHLFPNVVQSASNSGVPNSTTPSSEGVLDFDAISRSLGSGTAGGGMTMGSGTYDNGDPTFDND